MKCLPHLSFVLLIKSLLVCTALFSFGRGQPPTASNSQIIAGPVLFEPFREPQFVILELYWSSLRPSQYSSAVNMLNWKTLFYSQLELGNEELSSSLNYWRKGIPTLLCRLLTGTAEMPSLVPDKLASELPAESSVSLRRAFLLLDRFWCYSVDFFFLITRLLIPINWLLCRIVIEPLPEPLKDPCYCFATVGYLTTWPSDVGGENLLVLEYWQRDVFNRHLSFTDRDMRAHTADISWTRNQASRQTLYLLWDLRLPGPSIALHPSSSLILSGRPPQPMLDSSQQQRVRHSFSWTADGGMSTVPLCRLPAQPKPPAVVPAGSTTKLDRIFWWTVDFFLGRRVTFSQQEAFVRLTITTPHTRASEQFWLHLHDSRRPNNCALLSGGPAISGPDG